MDASAAMISTPVGNDAFECAESVPLSGDVALSSALADATDDGCADSWPNSKPESDR